MSQLTPIQNDSFPASASLKKFSSKQLILAFAFVFILVCTNPAQADFNIHFSDADFDETDTFNEIFAFSFDISIDDDLVAGRAYDNPTINTLDYVVRGRLPNTTPSGFPAFGLVRSMDGTEFYNLSPESGLSFSIKGTADLSDGLQISELVGTTAVFNLNLREFNQDPGRYHPPIFTLNSDGTGRLVNANNKSTFKNPDPPQGSGLLVDVQIGEEYISDLTFNTSLTIAVPEPSSLLMLVLGIGGLALRRRR